MKEKRAIKFYLDESVNNIKKDKIMRFLKECQKVENYLLQYYWQNENFKIVISANTQIDFNYKNEISYKYTEPKLKSHHFQQVLQQVYKQLKSLQMNIINKIHFKFKDDKIKQRIYNYCSGFCFDWDYLNKYINKQLKSFKRKDKNYYDFLLEVNNYLTNKDLFNELKQDVEDRFYEIKSKYNIPQKKEYQIWCNTALTVDVELKEFQWVFTIDNNTPISTWCGRPIFDKMIIPVKFSEYHKQRLDGKKLANSFNLRLNKYNKIELIGVYEVEIENEVNEITNTVGIDIGLKKLIVSSDGEIVEQNPKILKKLSKIVKKQKNRQCLQSHLQKKLNDESFMLSDKHYLKMQTRLSTFVKTDNRYKIKQFLEGRENDLIVMEDLDIGYSKTHSKQVNYLLKRLGIQGIKNSLLDYCKKLGINTQLINPAFTSQQCPICGYISKENRKTQEMFSCVKCNHTDNADHNASINIRERINNKKITLNMPTWKVAQVLGVEGY